MRGDEQKTRGDEMKKLTPLGVRRKLKMIESALEANDAEWAELRAKFFEVQDRCPHVNMQRHPDPSGGSDSVIECLDCGKEW